MRQIKGPVGYMILSSLAFAIMGVFIKMLQRLPTWEVVFFRALVNFFWLLPWALANPVKQMVMKEPKALLSRGISGCLSMVLYFYAIEHIKLADAVMLNYFSPIIVLILSAVLLGERLSKMAIGFILVAFSGVGLILKPDFSFSNTSAEIAGIAGLLSAFVAAIAYISIKVATRTVPPRYIVFSFASVSVLMSVVPMLMFYVQPTPQEWAALLLAGSLATIAQEMMTRGYAGLPASVASPLTLTTVFFSAVLAWGVWGEIPDQWSMLGSLLVVCGLVGAFKWRAVV